MDEYIYNNIEHYFSALKKVGYYRYKDVYKLLVLIFWYHILFEDYRGYVKREDYRLIEKGLNCLYGTTCLIPYTDYLKMGKLKLGEMTELLSRTKSVEEEISQYDQRILDNDALIADNTRRLDEQDSRISELESTKVVKGKNHIQNIPDLDLSAYDMVED